MVHVNVTFLKLLMKLNLDFSNTLFIYGLINDVVSSSN